MDPFLSKPKYQLCHTYAHFKVISWPFLTLFERQYVRRRRESPELSDRDGNRTQVAKSMSMPYVRALPTAPLAYTHMNILVESWCKVSESTVERGF